MVEKRVEYKGKKGGKHGKQSLMWPRVINKRNWSACLLTLFHALFEIQKKVIRHFQEFVTKAHNLDFLICQMSYVIRHMDFYFCLPL